ncbi:MAG: RNA polymerase sigma factor [Planctomycetota bacterium]
MDRRESTALLNDAKAGSREALNTLFERCAGRLLALIRLRMGRSLRAHLESQDILQASLLKAFARIDQLERSDAGSLMAWLARIAEHEIRDQADYHHRKRRDAARLVPLGCGPDGLAAQVRSLVSGVILSESMERLEQALESLDDKYREIIMLRKFEELSFQEIGQRTGKSPDACRMQLARALTALTLRMNEVT